MGLWLNWRRWISLVTLELSLETDKILPCPPFEERVSSRTRNTYMLLSRSILYLWLEIFRKLVWKRVYRQLDRQMVNRLLLLLSHFSRVWLCVTPQTAAHQSPSSLGFSKQEHWSGLPFPSPMHETGKWKLKVKSFSRVRLLATAWTAAYQPPPSMGSSKQEYWSGVPLPSLVCISNYLQIKTVAFAPYIFPIKGVGFRVGLFFSTFTLYLWDL